MSFNFTGGITPGFLYDESENHCCNQDSIFFTETLTEKKIFFQGYKTNDRAETRNCVLVHLLVMVFIHTYFMGPILDRTKKRSQAKH